MRTNRMSRVLGVVAGGGFAVALTLLVWSIASARPRPSEVLKEAKLNIEHNATDHDTGFQGAVDSEGWQSLDLMGPSGFVLNFDAKGALGELGLTELFFETVEPENAEVPLERILSALPAGQYTFNARGMIAGERTGEVRGTAWLTHDIPAGPELLWPANGSVVPVGDLDIRWNPVTQSLRGGPINIIAYQLIVERDTPTHPHMIGKWGLSMYLPASATSMTVSRSFLEPNTAYKWEVLAIEESGNQTLSSGEFRTQ